MIESLPCVTDSEPMADAAASVLSTISTLQSSLLVLNSLMLTSYQYPPNATVAHGDSFDYIVVGGGSAGCVLANRLSENSDVTVLLLEAGGPPPFEANLPGLFTAIPRSVYDYDFYSEDDKYSAQNLQGAKVGLTAGKMLGGSSALNHMIHVQGDPHDFDNWAEIVGDDSWSYANVLQYFKKIEKLTDDDLLNSSFKELHGTDGMIKIKREVSESSNNFLEAFAEMGVPYVDDTTSETSSIGSTNPLFDIDDDIRQNNALAYLGPIKERTNLFVALSMTATKILIKDASAYGVQVATAGGESIELYANQEVIVTAGAINSPKLLMLSGIGPKSHLESLGIDVVADLPVGQNFMDHPSAAVVIQMETSTAPPPPMNPTVFPVPTTTYYKAIDSSQSYPDYQTINLVFPHDSSAQLQLCANVFKYSNAICNEFYAATVNTTTVFVVHNLMMPKSRGQVLLASADPEDAPLIYTGTYSDSSDLTLMGQCLEDFAEVVNTAYFESVGAKIVNPGFCTDKTGTEFWECYALAMSATMWHYAGTCAMGSVVDSTLVVKGVENLRVADASAMPTQVSGNINTAVTMIAEKASADIIAKLAQSSNEKSTKSGNILVQLVEGVKGVVSKIG